MMRRHAEEDLELHTWMRTWVNGATPNLSFCAALSKDMRDKPNSPFVTL